MAEKEPLNFSCRNCGKSFSARPPYEGYDIALQKPCQKKDHDSPQLYECESCHERNVIYWCQG